MTVIHVATDTPYDVTVGRNLVHQVANAVPANVAQVAVIHAPTMKNFAQEIAQTLSAEVTFIELGDGEKAKTLSQIEHCWNVLGDNKFTRSDLVISVGGGATTDAAGYVAASWLRGIRVIHVPTTLLAMVDAAVGGKTGINSPAGKNLIGAFHHPVAVLCDLDVLKTLPIEDIRAGFGEIVKCGFIRDPHILTAVEQFGADLLDAEHPALEELVVRAIAVKAEVVADDFKEDKPGGLGREILNYGHTFGHAVEHAEHYAIRHGEAVSIGMIFVAHLAESAGILSRTEVQRHREILNCLGLPTTYSGQTFAHLVDLMSIDKKVRGAKLRFIGLAGLQNPQVIESPSEEMLKLAFNSVAGA